MQPISARHDQRLHHHRDPEVRTITGTGALKSARSHANHVQGGAIHVNRGSDHRSIPIESALPVVIIQDHEWVLARRLRILWRENAADGRIYTEHGKIIF